MKEEFDIIRCPHCDAEYLPSEIFYPNDFLGKPSDIEKTSTGEILCAYGGTSQKFAEEFVCEYCNKPLIITTKHSYNVAVNLKKDNDAFTTPLYKDRIILKED